MKGLRFPRSKPVVGQNIALHAVPAYRVSKYVVSAFPVHSTSFSASFSSPERWNEYLSCESECLLVLGIQFVSPRYDPSRLTGCKTSSIYIYISAHMHSLWIITQMLV